MKKLLGITVLLAALYGGVALAQWDTAPTAPLRAINHSDYAGFDIQVSESHSNMWYAIPAFQAQHGTGCEAPPASHQVTQFADAVFVCSNHIMTSMNSGDGYGEVIITPNKLLDWTNGPATVDFEVSTLKMSSRDWIDVMLSPYLENSANYDDHQAERYPKTGYQFGGLNGLLLQRIVNFQGVQSYGSVGSAMSEGVVSGTNQAAVRQHFRITMSSTHARYERLASPSAPARVYVDVNIPTTTFTQAVVQFGHHDYNPTKDNSGQPATWHWDEFQLNPSVPFTIIHATQRVVPATLQGNSVSDVHFLAPAPANSYIRFAAVGKAEVSTNGGATYVKAAEMNPSDGFDPDGKWLAIPAGTQDVKIRLSKATGSWYNGPFMARDFAIWSLSPGGAPSSTATPLPNTPVATPTVSVAPTSTGTALVPPTATATSVISNTATPAVPATATSIPSPSPIPSTPTFTPTPTPAVTTTCFSAAPLVELVAGKYRVTGPEVPC